MTQPPDPALAALQDTLKTLQQTVETLKVSVDGLNRGMQGDPNTGTPAIRTAVQSLKDDLKADIKAMRDEMKIDIKAIANEVDAETAALGHRVDTLEQKARDSESYLRGITTVLRWLGGGSLVLLLASIAAVVRLLGGHP